MSHDLYRADNEVFASDASSEERGAFINRTYLHLLGAVVAFLAIDTVLLQAPFTPALVQTMAGGAGGYSWLIVLGAFMGVSWLANSWAHSSTSLAMQYTGLGLYVVAQSIISLPLLYVAANFGGPNVIPTAGIATGAIFLGLTAVVFVTRKNFSFLGPFLGIAGMGALAFIVCSILFGFTIGNLFTVLMIVFACGYILYDTSRVLHEYHTSQHVAAALALFASVVLLFWYILRLFTSRD